MVAARFCTVSSLPDIVCRSGILPELSKEEAPFPELSEVFPLFLLPDAEYLPEAPLYMDEAAQQTADLSSPPLQSDQDTLLLHCDKFETLLPCHA